MVNWTEIEALANTCLVLTSAGAIGYAGLQLRHEREYRSATNLEKQMEFFQADGFVDARRRLAKDRLTKDTKELVPWELDEPPVSAFEVLDFYEHIGLLVKKGHLEIYDVWHTFYEWAQPVYVDMQPLIESDESAYRDHYSDLRKLMRQMDDIQLARMHEKNANHWALWTPDRILEHYRYELEIAGYSGRGKRSAARSAERRRAREQEELERLEQEAVGGTRPDGSLLDLDATGDTDDARQMAHEARELRRQKLLAEESMRQRAAMERLERMRNARGQ